MNVDLIRDQLDAIEKAVAAAGGSTFSQINLRYSLTMPPPTVKWATDTLKSFGLEGNDLLIFPHRRGGEYDGLLVTVLPARDLPDPWQAIGYITMTNDIDPHWYHSGLNKEYSEWCAQKAPTHGT